MKNSLSPILRWPYFITEQARVNVFDKEWVIFFVTTSSVYTGRYLIPASCFESPSEIDSFDDWVRSIVSFNRNEYKRARVRVTATLDIKLCSHFVEDKND